MATFDPGYKDRVIKAWAKSGTHGKLGQLRDAVRAKTTDTSDKSFTRLDLHELFAIPAPATGIDLAEHGAGLKRTLNKERDKQTPSAACASSILALWDLCAANEPHWFEASYWDNLHQEVGKHQQEALDELVSVLEQEYPLRVVPLSQLDVQLVAHGLETVPAEKVQQALLNVGLTAAKDVEEPQDSTTPGLEAAWRAAASVPEFATVLDLVLYQRRTGQVKFLDELSCSGKRISLADAIQSKSIVERAKDTDAQQAALKFLGSLVKDCTSDDMLRGFVAWAIFDQARRSLDAGSLRASVKAKLVDAGLEPTDVARMLTTLTQSGGGGKKFGVDAVLAKLADGDLTGAQNALAVIKPDNVDAAELDTLRQRISRLVDEKRDHVKTYRAAVEARRWEEAAAELEAALVIDRADVLLAEERSFLPPPPPGAVSAQTGGAELVLQWLPSPGENVRYCVVRNDHSPAHARDGSVVNASTPDETLIDPSAPVAETIHYAVFATCNGQTYSDPARASVLYVPSPANCALSTDATSVEVAWDRPAGAASCGLTLTAPDGSQQQVEVAEASSATFPGLRSAQTYLLEIVALYRRGGKEFRSAPVRLSAVPRLQARPVSDLVIDPDPNQQGGFLAHWSTQPGHLVELWTLPKGSVLQVGETVSTGDWNQRAGRRLDVAPRGAAGGRTSVGFSLGAEMTRVVAVLVDGDRRIVGASRTIGAAEMPSDVELLNLGTWQRLSWAWPKSAHFAIVTWEDEGGPQSKRVGDAEYRNNGGVMIPAQATRIRLQSGVGFDGDEFVSGTVSIAELESKPQLSYQLQHRRSLLGKTTWTVTCTSDTPGIIITARLIQSFAQFMPRSLNDGHMASTFELDFSKESTVRQQLELPRDKRPYWIALFVDPADSAHVFPPPTETMKG